MRNLKKILALVLALMMVLSVMATASALDFTDADEIKNTEAVSVMAGLGILSGNPTADGQFAFNPTGTLTRGQAAKILAYVVTGDDDYVKEVAAHLEHPFTDSVGHWAEAYIAYCYDEGLISGKNATTFDPNGTLSGYALGKLLLCAAGIGEKADYEGAGWEVNVFKALKNNNLLTNVSVSKANITRDNACQLVWNVMNWNGETSEYVVTVGDKVIYQGTDYEYATMLALIKDGAELGTVESIVGSLVDVVFGLKINETKDAFGRVTKTYTSNVEGMNVVLKNDVAPLTFVAAEAIANLADLNKALGLTGDKVLTEATGAKCYTNGVETGLAAAAGDSVEVYLNADKEIAKVIVIHETLETAVIANSFIRHSEFDKGW